ncbi:MAG: sigma-54 dependent transcriptional regulator [Polaromonas sp.]
MTIKKLLLIEDDPILGESLQQRFELEGVRVQWCRRLAEAAIHIDHPHLAVISDVRLPDGLATDWFVTLPDTTRQTPWFFLTGYGSVDDAVSALRAGAKEYLTKPFDIEQLVSMVLAALTPKTTDAEQGVLGVSPAMRRVEEVLHKVARQKSPLLLTGESGVGKEVAAHLVHTLDSRISKGEFIAVNCAAVPEAMMEAEFFGYEKGAFTGALRAHKGFVERANNGTLFLDEVGELPASMQAKLLRVLQERCFFRLGAERTTVSDFRVVAATNRDLYAAMLAGTFREDLFYRLAVIRVELPPLRERIEDIRWLSERLLQSMSAEQQRPIAVSEPFMRDLMARNWRGNVRELRGYLEQAIVMSDGGILDVPDIANSRNEVSLHADTQADAEILPLKAMVEFTERKHIVEVLTHVDGSITLAADVLRISRKSLWEKMKRHGVDKTQY